ncbi:MAG: 2-phosphosulfolactate phosphatase [Haloarculaceae archaeon]
MSVLADLADPHVEETLTEHIVPARPLIPEDPPAGNYVVIDVTHFSTTVVELFVEGAEYVHVTEERGDEHAFKADHPRAKIGGGSVGERRPEEGYDFFNSPSSVHRTDVAGRPVAMTSTNGGASVTDLRKAGDDVDVYVGGLTNAAAVADHLAEAPRPTYLVGAGSDGTASPEDVVGALVIGRRLFGEPPTPTEREVYRQVVYNAKAPKYRRQSEVRVTDLEEYDLAFNERSVVPRLDGQKLYDVA